MASRKFLGVFLLSVLLVAIVKGEADAEADAWAEAGPDPASCCNRPTTFVKGSLFIDYA
jgi:hypothetical protein